MQHNEQYELQQFFNWLEEVTATGFACPASDQIAHFVPYTAITSYFDDIRRLRRLLNAVYDGVEHNLDVEQIRRDCPRVLCILILINKGRYISHFSRHESLWDNRLGWSQKPSEFPKTGNNRFESAFSQAQWKFCAQDIVPAATCELTAERIWPIIQKEPIATGSSAEVFKILVHKDYDRLPLQDNENNDKRTARCFALKIYRGPNSRRQFDNETLGYAKLKSHANPLDNIVKFYGGYIQNGDCYTILEYADSHTLEDLFTQVQSPGSAEEIFDFWIEIFGVARALYLVHQIQPDESPDAGTTLGWHQDVRPANILVCSKPSGFGYRFLLSDLGLSHFKKVSSDTDLADWDSRGSRTYGIMSATTCKYSTYCHAGAPECYRFDALFARYPLAVKQNVDVWSLGCVYSEAAVWVACGLKGLSSYRQRRSNETSKTPGFRDGDCFHNGEHTLSCVEEFHNSVIQNVSRSDPLTIPVVERIIPWMLDERIDGRLSSQQVLRQLEKMIKQGRAALTAVLERNSKGHSRQMSASTYPNVADAIDHRWAIGYDIGESSSYRTTYHPPTLNQHTHHAPVHLQRPVSTASNDAFVQTPISMPKSFSNEVESTEQTEGGVNSLTTQIEASTTSYFTPSRSTAPSQEQRYRTSPSEFGSDSTHYHTAENSVELKSPQNRVRHYRQEAGLNSNLEANPSSDPVSVGRQKQNEDRPIEAMHTNGVGTLKSIQPLLAAEAISWKNEKKRGYDSKLPNEYLLKNLNKRDHLFLVDDAATMTPYWKDVINLIDILAYMTKDSDPDGLELHFTIHTKTIKAKKATILTDQLRRMTPDGKSDISQRLGTILQDYQQKLAYQNQNKSRRTSLLSRKSKTVRPLNIYILTDGIWQDRTDAKPPIQMIVNKLIDLQLLRQQIGISFIRFGKSEVGLERLKELDSRLGLKLDIVDYTEWNGDVWKMLLGGINDTFDENDE